MKIEDFLTDHHKFILNGGSKGQQIHLMDWKPKWVIYSDMWYLIKPGKPIMKTEEKKEWCKINCKGKWKAWSVAYWLFEDATDAMYFKIVWGTR